LVSIGGDPLNQPLTPAPVPSAVDPHTVERAWFRGVKVERATVRTTLTPLGRVCSALPGSTVDGMGAHHARHDVPAAGNGAPSHPVPADPPPEASSVTVGRMRRVIDS